MTVKEASQLVFQTKLTIVIFSWMRWSRSADSKNSSRDSKRGSLESSKVKTPEQTKLMMI